jgi:hypothetical protein
MRTIWDIQAEIIYVSEEGLILPWILRDSSKRLRAWEGDWVFSDSYLKKLRLLD